MLEVFLCCSPADREIAAAIAARLEHNAEITVALRDAAELREDWRVSDDCSWELSWVRNVPYRGADRAPVHGDQLSFDFAC